MILKLTFKQLSLDSYFTHEKPLLISIYGTKRHEMSVTISTFCLSIFLFGVLNGSALYRYLLFFIPELCAFMKLS